MKTINTISSLVFWHWRIDGNRWRRFSQVRFEHQATSYFQLRCLFLFFCCQPFTVIWSKLHMKYYRCITYYISFIIIYTLYELTDFSWHLELTVYEVIFYVIHFSMASTFLSCTIITVHREYAFCGWLCSNRLQSAGYGMPTTSPMTSQTWLDEVTRNFSNIPTNFRFQLWHL